MLAACHYRVYIIYSIKHIFSADSQWKWLKISENTYLANILGSMDTFVGPFLFFVFGPGVLVGNGIILNICTFLREKKKSVVSCEQHFFIRNLLKKKHISIGNEYNLYYKFLYIWFVSVTTYYPYYQKSKKANLKQTKFLHV